MSYRIERISKDHDRASFDCGDEDLNRWFQRYARQNEVIDYSRTYVAVNEETGSIVGFYAISTGAIEFENFPDDLKKQLNLPRYPAPVAHLGRLAVSVDHQGEGLGGQLLIDALAKAVMAAESVGLFAIEVLAKDEQARGFYEKYGFQSLVDDPDHLYLSITVARNAVDLIGVGSAKSA